MQKHIQQEECDVLPLSTWLTEVFNRSRVKKLAILADRCCPCLQTPTTIDNVCVCGWVQVNHSRDDWVLVAKVTGRFFSGPGTLNAPAGQVTDYPLKFLPLFEGACEVMQYVLL